MTIPTFIYDVECYRNYFLVVLLNADSGEWTYWELHNNLQKWPLFIPAGSRLIGFNSRNYDHPVLSAAMQGAYNWELKEVSDKVILEGMMFWEHKHDLDNRFDYIDIIEVLPGQANLKIYGGRIGCEKLQDLPIDPATTITYPMAAQLREYCYNDCMVTLALYNKVKPQIDLRCRLGQKYNLDLRSKSDAQIAEAVITSEYSNLTGQKVEKPSSRALIGKAFRYQPPPFLKFETPEMNALLQEIINTDFVVSEKGSIKLPDNLHNRVVDLHGGKYKMGIGGLHSVDRPGSFYRTDNERLWDIDVTSYYPSIIINCGYAPAQMGDNFLKVYKSLVKQRLEAKKSGDKVTADTLKITINGSFGKFGSRYSKLYSPSLLIHVTITGQLALLMMIERLKGYVISANTDGITIRNPLYDQSEIEHLVHGWEYETGFNMEWTEYRSLHRRDVNNYLAITTEGKTKNKGIFAPGGVNKNPVNEVIIKAVIEYFLNSTPIDEFIRNHKIVQDFTSLRTVRGGAMKNGIRYGKSVRWYWSNKERTSIYYQTSGNAVPSTESSRMMMDLANTMPDDIDYDRYIKEAEKLKEQII